MTQGTLVYNGLGEPFEECGWFQLDVSGNFGGGIVKVWRLLDDGVIAEVPDTAMTADAVGSVYDIGDGCATLMLSMESAVDPAVSWQATAYRGPVEHWKSLHPHDYAIRDESGELVPPGELFEFAFMATLAAFVIFLAVSGLFFMARDALRPLKRFFEAWRLYEEWIDEHRPT